MKLSISEAARRAGVKRPTLYRKIEKGLLTKEKDEHGNPVIDLSELVRIWPHAINEPATNGQPAADRQVSDGHFDTGGCSGKTPCYVS